jgi:hypothetical protein
MTRLRRFTFLLATATGLLALLALATPAQQPQQSAPSQEVAPSERAYNHSQVEVEKALQAMDAYSTQRLPVLDGFVNASAASLDRLDNPHYQLHIEIVPQSPTQTVVRVLAKITAWFADPDPGKSQYTIIPSNGRLEEDFLDRLSLKLEKSAASRPKPVVDSPLSPVSVTSNSASGSAPAPDPSGHSAPSSDAADIAHQIDLIRAQRDSLEEQQRKLAQHVSELESLSKTQVYIKNVAIVKAPDTPLFEAAEPTSKVLFRAEPQDEFEILEVRPGWARVRTENGGEAWVRGAQLEQPGDTSDSDDTAAAMNFSVSNVEVKPFEGEWVQLKGKPVLFVFAQPARQISDKMLGPAQLAYAKHTFVEGYREATHSQQHMEGVVVVFFGPKGGVAAATLPDIRRWQEGLITDKLFLERSSLDPRSAFLP